MPVYNYVISYQSPNNAVGDKIIPDSIRLYPDLNIRRVARTLRAGSLWCAVVLWRTHSGRSIPRSGLHGTEGQTLGDIELVCNEAVQSRGRRPGIPFPPLFS